MNIGENIRPRHTAKILNRSLADIMWKNVISNVEYDARKEISRVNRALNVSFTIRFDL